MSTENFIKGRIAETYTEKLIKGRIAETLVNRLLSELGFFVLPFGKEHAAAPITSIERFVKTCEGNFKFDENLKDSAKRFVDILPDFIAVSASGRTELIEVKYKRDGRLYQQDDSDKEVFKLYPAAVLLVVNSEVEKTRFNILCSDENFNISSRPLADWLVEKHGCDVNKVNKVISEHEEYVRTWYPKKEN